MIVDCTATGSTLRANGLVVVDTLLRSSTRLYASHDASANDARRCRIEDLAMLLRSVLEARHRVMLEVNTSVACLERVVAVLPSMRRPTVSPMYGDGSYAIKAAVPRDALARVIPALKASGGKGRRRFDAFAPMRPGWRALKGWKRTRERPNGGHVDQRWRERSRSDCRARLVHDSGAPAAGRA